jgi:hypothetical protein
VSVSIANTDANVSGKTVVLAERDHTISGLHTFSRSPSAPFAVASGSAAVTNLDADKLDGQEGTYYLNASNLASGTVPAARLAAQDNSICGGRLTLTSGTPVTMTDVAGATTLYYTPYKGNRIALYDGSAWNIRTFSELSITNAGLTNGKPYDVFVYDNAGTPALELLVWTNDTTRATALITQDGVYVKTGATTRRYVGTIYTSGGAAAFYDQEKFRFVWNYYNRRPRELRRLETTASWNYTTAAFRQANNSGLNQVDMVIGVPEGGFALQLVAQAQNTTSNAGIHVGIGLDSATTPMTTASGGFGLLAGGATVGYQELRASLSVPPTVGRHYYTWLEYSGAGGVTTWYGSSNSNALAAGQYGLSGWIEG